MELCIALQRSLPKALPFPFGLIQYVRRLSCLGSVPRGVVIRASTFAFLHHALLPSASVVSLSCCRCMKAVLAFLKAMLHWLRALWYACHASVVPERFAAAKNRCFCRESLYNVEFIQILFFGRTVITFIGTYLFRISRKTPCQADHAGSTSRVPWIASNSGAAESASLKPGQSACSKSGKIRERCIKMLIHRIPEAQNGKPTSSISCSSFTFKSTTSLWSFTFFSFRRVYSGHLIPVRPFSTPALP